MKDGVEGNWVGRLFLFLLRVFIIDVELFLFIIFRLKFLVVLEKIEREMILGFGVNGKIKCYIFEGENNRCFIKMYLIL